MFLPSIGASAVAEELVQGCLYAVRLERLYDEVLGSGLDRLHDHALLTHRRDHRHFGVGVERHDLSKRRQAVGVRHRNVQQHRLRLLLLIDLDRFTAVARFDRLVAKLLHGGNTAHAHEGGVIYDEYGCHLHHLPLM